MLNIPQDTGSNEFLSENKNAESSDSIKHTSEKGDVTESTWLQEVGKIYYTDSVAKIRLSKGANLPNWKKKTSLSWLTSKNGRTWLRRAGSWRQMKYYMSVIPNDFSKGSFITLSIDPQIWNMFSQEERYLKAGIDVPEFIRALRKGFLYEDKFYQSDALYAKKLEFNKKWEAHWHIALLDETYFDRNALQTIWRWGNVHVTQCHKRTKKYLLKYPFADEIPDYIKKASRTRFFEAPGLIMEINSKSIIKKQLGDKAIQPVNEAEKTHSVFKDEQFSAATFPVTEALKENKADASDSVVTNYIGNLSEKMKKKRKKRRELTNAERIQRDERTLKCFLEGKFYWEKQLNEPVVEFIKKNKKIFEEHNYRITENRYGQEKLYRINFDDRELIQKISSLIDENTKKELN